MCNTTAAEMLEGCSSSLGTRCRTASFTFVLLQLIVLWSLQFMYMIVADSFSGVMYMKIWSQLVLLLDASE